MDEVLPVKKQNKWVLLIIAVLTFLSFQLDVVLSSVATTDFSIEGMTAYRIKIFIAWGACAALLYLLAKHIGGYDAFACKDIPSSNGWIHLILIAVIKFVISFVAWGFRFKPLVEFINYNKYFPEAGTAMFLMQYAYYMFEAVLMCLLISISHQDCLLIFRNQKLPWGAIFFTLTWGLLHIWTQGLVSGLITTATAFLLGLACLAVKRNIRIAFPLIYLLFVI